MYRTILQVCARGTDVMIERKEIAGESLTQLIEQVGEFIRNNGLGASDVGARFPVTGPDGRPAGLLSYNGRFFPA